MNEKIVYKSKVLTRNFIRDFIARWLNFFGMRIKSYEQMINEGIGLILKELEEEKIELEWYRTEITQLTNGAIAILVYGMRK